MNIKSIIKRMPKFADEKGRPVIYDEGSNAFVSYKISGKPSGSPESWGPFENEEVAELISMLASPFIPEEHGWKRDGMRSNSFSAYYEHSSGEVGQKTMIETNYHLDREYRTYFFQKRKVFDFGLGIPQTVFNGRIHNLAEYKMLEKSVL